MSDERTRTHPKSSHPVRNSAARCNSGAVGALLCSIASLARAVRCLATTSTIAVSSGRSGYASFKISSPWAAKAPGAADWLVGLLVDRLTRVFRHFVCNEALRNVYAITGDDTQQVYVHISHKPQPRKKKKAHQ